MCGICGIWGQSDQPAVSAMVDAMHHRGPDDSGVFVDEKVSLGMTRLAIIDLSPAAHQPMSNPQETIWIVFNGEIYNFKEQRSHLEKLGHQFKSNSDTEVILKLYEQYGDDFLLRLRGMFALAIYDKRNKPRLLLARDQLGIKPLLYTEIGGGLVFASEIKGLLASSLVEKTLDPESLRLLLTFGSIFQPHTILKNVKMLMPAHRMLVEDGKIRIERYWSLGIDRVPGLRGLPYEEQVSALRQALTESVGKHLVSDVPVGAFLSGGIDSSILVSLMARQAGKRINTFSVGFGDEGSEIDESGDARRTADFLGTNHHHVHVSGKDVLDHIHRFASALDQPSVDGANSYFVSMAARQGMTVAISGTGGDELFAGYPWFRNMLDYQQPAWKEKLASLSRQPLLDGLVGSPYSRYLLKARHMAGFVSRYALQYQIFGTEGAWKLISPDLRHQAHAGRAESIDLQPLDELSHESIIARITALCLRGYTSNQLLRDVDAVSMYHSLEVRVPFLDVEMCNLALSLPDETKLNMDQKNTDDVSYRATGAKRILIDAGRPFLPKDFDRQPKRGFAMPFEHWLKGPLYDVMSQALSSDAVSRRGWFNPMEVAKVQDSFIKGKIHWSFPWLLMMTELWALAVLDG